MLVFDSYSQTTVFVYFERATYGRYLSHLIVYPSVIYSKGNLDTASGNSSMNIYSIVKKQAIL
jgi:hypothetical protein